MCNGTGLIYTYQVNLKQNKMNTHKSIDWIILITCAVGLLIEFSSPACTYVFENILGITGLIYCTNYLLIGLFHPIKRDWILAKGNFLLKVVNFVLLVPFVLVFAFNYYDKSGGSQTEFSPMNLVYAENLYNCEKEESDTLGISTMEIFQDSVFLKAHNLGTVNDTVIVQKNKSSDSGISEQEHPSLFWTVYYHFIDPGNQHMTTSEKGRNRAALIAISGFLLLNGLLISTLISWFDRRRDLWIKGEITYGYFVSRWSLRKHYIVIGGNDMAVGIVDQLLKKDNCLFPPYVVIQTSNDVETLRRELFSTLTRKQQECVVIYYGSSTSRKDLSKLGLNNAKEVYILGESTRPDDIDSYHDTINMECMRQLQELYMQTPKGKKITASLEPVNKLKEELAKTDNKKLLLEKASNIRLEQKWKNRPRLNCRVMFEYQTTFSVFQFFDIDEQMTAYINFTPFNYYEMWAQKVLINRDVEKKVIEEKFKNSDCYLPLEGSEGIKEDSDNYVHLFVVGMSRMGIAMGIEAAHLAHYPNYTEQNKIRTRITFIDTNAAKEKEFFIGRFKDLFNLSHWRYGVAKEKTLLWKHTCSPEPEICDHLGGDFLDIEWEFINGGIEQKSIQDYILSSAKPNARVTVAICLPESNKAHAAALYLDRKIYESDNLLQVLVYNRNGKAIIDAISKNNSRYPYHGKLKSFGCPSECMVINHVEISEYIGNQIDKAYNGGKESKAIEETIYKGKSKEAMRWSSIYNGNTMWTKLRSIGFDPQNPSIDENAVKILADVEHNRWNIEELLMNFRSLTPPEQNDVIAQKVTKNKTKSEMAHLDLCSNKTLLKIDEGAQKYDKELTIALGAIYRNVKTMEEHTKNKS